MLFPPVRFDGNFITQFLYGFYIDEVDKENQGVILRIGALIAVVLIVFLCAAAALKIILYIFGRDRADGRRS